MTDLPTTTRSSIPNELRTRLSADPVKRLDEVIAYFRQHRQPVELFEALKMKTRLRLGMSMVPPPDAETTSDPSPHGRQEERELEDGLLDACRQAGAMLIEDGKIAEGWMYLRPTGDTSLAKRLLSGVEITDENYDEMVQILLHEGVDLARGYRAVLTQQGTCNSITLFDQAIAERPRSDRATAAACLLDHFYEELWSLVQADFRDRAPKHGVAPDSIEDELGRTCLGELITRHGWILGDGGYHLDTTHLSSTVRFATVLTDREEIDKAVQLCQYGKRLPADFQYPGDEPFVDFYPAHLAYFNALLGRDVDTAVRLFEQKARHVDVMEGGSGAIEVYVDLLDRLGRPAEALTAAMELFPEDVPTQRVMPDLMAMARSAMAAGHSDVVASLQDFLFERGDLLGVAAIAEIQPAT
ncbi:MAG: hypothetical protein AAGJ40_02060 [Planctomycetota bacterium]